MRPTRVDEGDDHGRRARIERLQRPDPWAVQAPSGRCAGRGASWWGEGWRLFTPAVGPWLLIVVISFVLTFFWPLSPSSAALPASAVPDPCGRPDARLPRHRSGRASDDQPPFRRFQAEGRVAADRGRDLYRGVACNRCFSWSAMLFVFFGAAMLSQLWTTHGLVADGAAARRRRAGWSWSESCSFCFSSAARHGGLVRAGAGCAAGSEPWAAMKVSFIGCLRNIVPFLIYGVVGIALAIVATIPLLLGWLVLGPVTLRRSTRATATSSSSRPRSAQLPSELRRRCQTIARTSRYPV